MSPEETVERFKTLGLSEQKAKETLKNSNVTKFLLAALEEVRNVLGFNFSHYFDYYYWVLAEYI